MKKNINDIAPVLTTHRVGEKRVLIAQGETDTDITQIAVTALKAGERAEAHRHPTMEEFFLFKKGETKMTVEQEEIMCHSGDFIRIPANTLHAIEAMTDIEIMTIGCAIHQA